MAVFVCASDETYDDNPGNFLYSGWAATVDTWENVFAPAWNERVLNGPPQIPYLHMTDINDWNWQAKFGMSLRDANNRIDEASRVIRSTGGLIPVSFKLERKKWDEILRNPFKGRMKMFQPDHLAYLWFAMTQLMWLHEEFGDEVEKVDFWVERNGRITDEMGAFHAGLKHDLEYIGRSYLSPLVGDFLPVGKDRIPAQAADMLAWHARNAARGKLDMSGRRRYWRMAEGGGTGRGRYGHRGEVTEEDLRLLAERFEGRLNGSISDEEAS